jgi:hypothetical protein
MVSKEKIIDEIKRTTQHNGGMPLGAARFQQETGISSYEWGRYWARFGDAVNAAGFEPNKFLIAYSDDFLISKLIGLTRKLKRFPTFREIQAEKTNDSELPDKKVFQRFGNKETILRKVVEFCKGKTEYDDIAQVCAPLLSDPGQREDQDIPDGECNVGEVYLFKSGRHYKIGKSCDTVRRGKELRIQLPETPNLIHSIRTDDPSGVEAYWHRRFESRRMNGEWFDLTQADIRAFKRWRRIY